MSRDALGRLDPAPARPAGVPRPRPPSAALLLRAHVRAAAEAVAALAAHLDTLDRWGAVLAERLPAGARLLVAGNGGSAALAEHLTAELVGRYRGDRAAYAAIALSGEAAAVTAIANDYGYDRCFSRQVEAFARPGDVLLCLSTSGRSPNLLRAAEAAGRAGSTTWAMTGPAGSPLATLADDALCTAAPIAATVQEVQQVAVHALCLAFEAALEAR